MSHDHGMASILGVLQVAGHWDYRGLLHVKQKTTYSCSSHHWVAGVYACIYLHR